MMLMEKIKMVAPYAQFKGVDGIVEWKLLDSQGEFLQEVNCQYDSLDIAVMLYGAEKVEVDLKTKVSKILVKEDE